MSLAAVFYLVLYGLISVAGIVSDIHDRKPSWFVACAVTANLIEAFLIAAYWHPVLVTGLGFVALTSFVLAMCWELYAGVVDLRDPELATLSNVRKAIWLMVAALLLVPAYVLAGLAAFNAL